MKLKNKKLLSILLGLEMTISFAGCEGLKDYHTSQNSTTYSSASQYTTYKAPVSETTTEEKEEPFIEDEGYVCALANLNLRKAPNLSSEVLEVIPKFSKLRKEKANGTFDYISYDGTYGGKRSQLGRNHQRIGKKINYISFRKKAFVRRIRMNGYESFFLFSRNLKRICTISVRHDILIVKSAEI